MFVGEPIPVNMSRFETGGQYASGPISAARKCCPGGSNYASKFRIVSDLYD
jgi:hypothetical protein